MKTETNQLCGCEYPNLVWLRDRKNPRGGTLRTCYCFIHGEQEIQVEGDPTLGENPIPTKEWRQTEKRMLIIESTLRQMQGD